MAEVSQVIVVEEGAGTVTVVIDEDGPTQVIEDETTVIEVDEGVVGPPGPAGPAGPAGEPGSAGVGSGYYVHTQAVSSAVWTIVHNLGYFPAVSVVDTANTTVIGSIQYLDANSIQVSFSAPFSGTAYLS